MMEVFTVKAYKIAHKHTTASFWDWCQTKRKAIKFKPQMIVRIQHGDEIAYSLISRNHIFSTLVNNNIRHAIYGEGSKSITLLLKCEAEAALLKLML